MKQNNVSLRSIAICLMAVVVIILPISLMSRNAGKIVFSPEGLAGLIENSVFNHEVLMRGMRSALGSSDLSKSGIERDTVVPRVLISIMDKGQWSRSLQVIIPEKLLSQTLRPIINSIFTWLDSSKEYPDIRIDTRPLKGHITGSIKPFMNSVFPMMPLCSPEQLRNLPAVMNPQALSSMGPSLVGSLPDCRIPEPYYGRLTSAIQRVVEPRIDEIPDEIDISAIMNPLQGTERSATCMRCHNHGLFKRDPHLKRITEVKEGLLSIRSWMNNFWIVVFFAYIFSFVLATIGIKSKPERLKWAGWPLMLSGVVSLLLSVYLPNSAEWIPEKMDIPPSILVIVQSIFTDLFTQVGSALLLQATLLTLFGAVALIVAQRRIKIAKRP
jgi:hypothetical protein